MARWTYSVVDTLEVSRRGLIPWSGICKAPYLSITVLVLLGLTLRLGPAVADPLHQDEALYGFWARLISSGRDLWMATVPIDKPPLVPYLIAGGQTAFGVSEFIIRMPGLAASLLSIPLTYVLAQRLYADRVTGLVAAGVMALTPYPVLFGSTAFTDPFLVVFWLIACYAALSGRCGWAGLFLGFALASKQQAIVLAPMVVGLGLVGWKDGSARGNWKVACARFVFGVAFVVVAIFGWDKLRVENGAAAGFWGQGVDSYGGLRLIWSTELIPRLWEWTRLFGYLFGWFGLGIVFVAGVAGLLYAGLTRQRLTRAGLGNLMLSVFVLAYLFSHWLIAFPVWDRYLLPVVPIAGLLLGQVATLFSGSKWDGGVQVRHSAPMWRYAFNTFMAVSLVGSGVMATSGRIPVGGDHGAYHGLTDTVRYLRTLPAGTVLYDRWLSWHFDYYLFDGQLYRAGFSSPGWLAADAAAFYDGSPRYLVLPSWESEDRLERALADVGLGMSSVLTTYRGDGTTSLVVYEIGAGHGHRR